MIKLNYINFILLIGFIALPIAGLMLHLKLHPDLTYLTWILWFDIAIITLLYLFNKSLIYGFILNTVFFVVGVVMHIMYVPGGGISDILLSIPDFSLGFILWALNKDEYGIKEDSAKPEIKSLRKNQENKKRN